MNDDEHKVETRTINWYELVQAFDKEFEREKALGPIVYEFGGGRVLKRDGLGPYGPWE